uniref:Uncharacterized protein n=1 Tax=Bigelowiella natans TaxID=227086 RepID=A0A7S2KNS6_BIGNA
MPTERVIQPPIQSPLGLTEEDHRIHIASAASKHPVNFTEFFDKYVERIGSPASDRGYERLDRQWFERLAIARNELNRKAIRAARFRISPDNKTEQTTYIPANMRKVPVLGLTVFHDDEKARFIDRLLRSIDTPIGTIVVTWYGNFSNEAHTVVRALRNGGYSHLIYDRLVINQYPFNMGFSFGVNEVIYEEMKAPWWLCVSYDIAYPMGVLGNIAELINSNLSLGEDIGIFSFDFIDHVNRPPWANFALTPHAIAKMGLFDENFVPVYFEDGDYEHRAVANEVRWVVKSSPSLKVIHGWADLKPHRSATLEDLERQQGSKIMKVLSAQREATHNAAYLDCKRGLKGYIEFESMRDPMKWTLDYKRLMCNYEVGLLATSEGPVDVIGKCLPERCRKHWIELGSIP